MITVFVNFGHFVGYKNIAINVVNTVNINGDNGSNDGINGGKYGYVPKPHALDKIP